MTRPKKNISSHGDGGSVHVRLPKSVLFEIDRAAKKRRQTRSEYLRDAIASHVMLSLYGLPS